MKIYGCVMFVLGAAQALKRCQLGDVIEKQPLGLDSPGMYIYI
jgi:hypothetical protein